MTALKWIYVGRMMVTIGLLVSPAHPDSFMSGDMSNVDQSPQQQQQFQQQQQQQFQSQQAGPIQARPQLQFSPVCAECVEKDSINIVQVRGNTNSNNGGAGQPRIQDGSQNGGNVLIDPCCATPDMLTTTIYETFPTVINGFQLFGKRTRISVYYATAAAQPQTQISNQGQQQQGFQQQGFQQQQSGQQAFQGAQQQGANFDQSGQTSASNQFQANPSQLQGFFSSSNNQGQMQNVNSGGVSSQGVSGMSSSFQSQQSQQQNNQNAGFRSGLGSSVNSLDTQNGQSAFPPVQSGSSIESNSDWSARSISPNSGRNIVGLSGAASSQSSSGNGFVQSNTGNLFQNSGNSGFVAATGTAGQFQDISPQPTQNFASAQPSSTGFGSGGKYQSISEYNFQGTNGYLTAGRATFEAATMGGPFMSVTDLRTVSPTMAQPNGFFLTSSTRLEAYHVPISGVNLRGVRTLYSYYYAQADGGRSGRDNGVTFATLSGPVPVVQPTPVLPMNAVNQAGVDSSRVQVSGSADSSSSSGAAVMETRSDVGTTGGVNSLTIINPSVRSAAGNPTIPGQPPASPFVSFQSGGRTVSSPTDSPASTTPPSSVAIGQSVNLFGNAINSGGFNAQPFTVADSSSSSSSGSVADSSSRNLDDLYNPTYNSNSGGGSSLNQQYYRSNAARADTGSGSGNSAGGSSGQNGMFRVLSNPNVQTSGDVQSRSNSPGTPASGDSSVSGTSSSGFDQGTGIRMVSASGSASSGQMDSNNRGFVQTGFRIADPSSGQPSIQSN